MRNERGSMSLLFLGVVGGFMLLVVAISAYESVYLARRRGQSAADAAALAAMQAVQQQLATVQQQALAAHVATWWDQVNDRIGSDMGNWWQYQLQAAQHFCQTNFPSTYSSCLSTQVQNINQSASTAQTAYRNYEAGQALHDKNLLGPILGNGSLPLVPSLLEFVPNSELACLPYRAARQANATMQSRASVLATANGATSVEPVEFPYDDTTKVRVIVHQPIPLGPVKTWVDAQYQQVTVESTTVLSNSPGLPIHPASQCP